MSDSVSDKKVEDVLSSVRRLVSAELPRRRPEPKHDTGALVLTSAQRVEGGARERVRSKSLEERIAELEAAVSQRSDEWEPDGSEDQTQHRPHRIVFTPSESPEANLRRRRSLRLSELSLVESGSQEEAAVAEVEETVVPTFRHEAETAGEGAHVPEAPMEADAQEPARTAEIRPFRSPDEMMDEVTARWARAERGEPEAQAPEAVAEVEDAAADVVAEAEETASEPDPVDEVVEDTEDGVSDDAQAVEVAEDAVFEAGVAGVEEAEAGETDDAEAVEAEAAKAVEAETVEADEVATADAESDHVETPEAEAAEGGEPDEVGETDTGEVQAADEEEEPGTEPADAEDEAAFEAALSEAVAASVPETLAAAVTGKVADAAPVVDEDSLRPLVSRLIREELQGELGERITRNVRKLVRQEIYRTLNARDVQ